MSKYRALSFMVGVAVDNNLQGAMVARVQDINDSVPDPDIEIFKSNLVKDYAASLTVTDMKEFIHWLTTAPFQVVCSRERLTKKLNELRHFRLATYHVMHPEGRVPESQSML